MPAGEDAAVAALPRRAGTPFGHPAVMAAGALQVLGVGVAAVLAEGGWRGTGWRRRVVDADAARGQDNEGGEEFHGAPP